MKFLSLTLVAIFVALGAWAGDGTKGGLVVQINDQWVPIEEAISYVSSIFEGLSELPTGQPSKIIPPKFNKDYGASLQLWVNFLATLSPTQAKELTDSGELVRFVYVNAPLVQKPTDLPDNNPIDFKAYRKAAVFVPSEMDYGTVYVSIPVMEDMGSLGDDRLTVKQNQGFLLLHELINAHYREVSANQREIIGQSIIEAFIEHLPTNQYGLHLSRRGGPYMTDPKIGISEKLAVLNLAKEKGLLGKVKLDGVAVSENDLSELVDLNGYLTDPNKIDVALSSLANVRKFLDSFNTESKVFGKTSSGFLLEKYGDKFQSLPSLNWKPNIEDYRNFYKESKTPLATVVQGVVRKRVMDDCQGVIKGDDLCRYATDGSTFTLDHKSKNLVYAIASGPSSPFKNWSLIQIIVRDSGRDVVTGEDAMLFEPGASTWTKIPSDGIVIDHQNSWDVRAGLYMCKRDRK
jgi:hypothetical protein